MPIDVDSFKASFPEFADAPAALVQAKLSYALTLTPNEVWGDDTDGGIRQQGAFHYTARFLALSPFARNLKLTGRKGETNYDGEIERLKRIVTSGFRSL